jgi:hypothetical protein
MSSSWPSLSLLLSSRPPLPPLSPLPSLSLGAALENFEINKFH